MKGQVIWFVLAALFLSAIRLQSPELLNAAAALGILLSVIGSLFSLCVLLSCATWGSSPDDAKVGDAILELDKGNQRSALRKGFSVAQDFFLLCVMAYAGAMWCAVLYGIAFVLALFAIRAAVASTADRIRAARAAAVVTPDCP